MTDQLELLQQRANDAIVQSRCDRRSLAVLAKALFEKGYHITSLSHLIRIIIEDCRQHHVDNGAEDILSYEDAENILNALKIGGLNPSGRGLSTLLKQQGKEALYLDGQDITYAVQPKVTNKMLESRKQVYIEAAKEVDMNDIARRVAEHKDTDEAVKDGLSRIPDNLIVEEEDNEKDQE